MKDRFDLENEIMELHSFISNLDSVAHGVMERDLSQDEIVNVLSGMSVLLELHISKLHDTMSQVFNLDEYNYEDTKRCCR
jgi:hypothetical protein